MPRHHIKADRHERNGDPKGDRRALRRLNAEDGLEGARRRPRTGQAEPADRRDETEQTSEQDLIRH